MKNVLILFLLLFLSLSAPGTAHTLATPVVILLGPPACGKSTQGKWLSKEIGFPYISSGDLLREAVSNQSDLGKEAATYLEKGHLVPDFLICKIIFERLDQPDAKNGYILDGFPRTISQAQALEKYTQQNIQPYVFYLDVSANIQEYLKRLDVRREKEKRADDTPEIAQERLKVYFDETSPLIHYFTKQNALYRIDGLKSAESIHEAIMAILKDHLVIP